MFSKTLDWVKSQEIGGLAAWPGSPAYPEVAGYMIPTLLAHGEYDLAKRLGNWLVKVQNPDGSFNGLDGLQHSFDTAACYEGMKALGLSEAKKALQYVRGSGLDHEVYLWRAQAIVGVLKKKAKPTPDLRTHYFLYAVEGYLTAGMFDWALEAIKKLNRGVMPYKLDGSGTDLCATAQMACIRLRLNLEADAELEVLRSHMNADGSFPASLDNPRQVIWVCKFALDADILLGRQFSSNAPFTGHYIQRGGWHPFGISGCFRVRNDHEFLKEAVESHLPYLDEAVIALQPSDNETEAVVSELARNPKVRIERYPVVPVFITDKDWENVPEDSIRSFVYLSNWALSQCNYSWIARIEADVVCLESFKKTRERIESEPERKMLYGRILLNLAPGGISATNPRNGGGDECVFPNLPEYRFVKRPKYEVLESPYESVCMGISGLHLKRLKSRLLPVWNGEIYVGLDKARIVMDEFNKTHPYPAEWNEDDWQDAISHSWR